MNIKCNKCGYSWEYKGKLLRATCPSCGFKCLTEKYYTKEEWKNE